MRVRCQALLVQVRKTRFEQKVKNMQGHREDLCVQSFKGFHKNYCNYAKYIQVIIDDSGVFAIYWLLNSL